MCAARAPRRARTPGRRLASRYWKTNSTTAQRGDRADADARVAEGDASGQQRRSRTPTGSTVRKIAGSSRERDAARRRRARPAIITKFRTFVTMKTSEDERGERERVVVRRRRSRASRMISAADQREGRVTSRGSMSARCQGAPCSERRRRARGQRRSRPRARAEQRHREHEREERARDRAAPDSTRQHVAAEREHEQQQRRARSAASPRPRR